MSDTDDEERVSVDFASVFALAEMQGEADTSTSTQVAQEKKKICVPSDFNPPTQQDVDWNVEVGKEKLVEKTFAFKGGKRQVGRAIAGAMETRL